MLTANNTETYGRRRRISDGAKEMKKIRTPRP
jgi:hypothetical protein